MGVGELMREEARQEAEGLMERMSQQVVDMTGSIPIIYLREGTTREELLDLLDEVRSISVQVLGAAVQADTPGPLITTLSSKRDTRLRIPITPPPRPLTQPATDP